MKAHFLRSAAAAILLAGLSAQSAAAETYPTRPIKLVIPFAAGGPADIVGREIARVLDKELGQPMVIVNLGGGHGVPALNQVLGAPADGYTLFMPASGNMTIPHPATKDLDLKRVLTPISQLTSSPHVLVISKTIPADNLKDFIAYARAHPGQVNFGSAGTGGVAHLGMEMFKSQAGVDVVHVPYRGTSQAVTDLVPGTIHALFSSMPSLKSMIDNGTIKAIGMSAPSKSDMTASIPVIANAGLPKMEYTTWYGLFAKAGTPPEIVATLNRAVKTALTDRALIEKLDPQGIELVSSSPEGLAQLVDVDTDKWTKLIAAQHITIE
ncbi:tripartite tricarboxylate transporter substrate binding protein [Alcaligenaceae bacterium A4P071]|nr:tripartite tricarboxylate transporter substrate binding protein [Alcaligenaceae bacterium A4P071]